MKITVIGKANVQGTSKKTGNPYNFIELHFTTSVTNVTEEHSWIHEKIREVLGTFPTLCYWCMADEIGGKQQFSEVWRDLTATHIFGKTGSGKPSRYGEIRTQERHTLDQ